MTSAFKIQFSLPALAALALILGTASAGDYWRNSGEPGVATNNDCGSIVVVAGSPQIRRSFLSAEAEGSVVYLADRVHAGDELVVPAGSLLEWHTGDNTVIVLGPASRARLDGLRNFTSSDGRPVARLDVLLLQGEMRVQVRLNVDRPEAVLVAVSGAEILVTRGDVEVRNAAAVRGAEIWRATAVSGEGTARHRRGQVLGAPFVFSGGAVGSQGETPVTPSELAAIRFRLPFSFESMRMALPPLPAISGLIEAP